MLFENDAIRTGYTRYFLPTVEIKTYNVKIDCRNVSDYATGFLLDYRYFKENYKMIAMDISKEYILDADPTAIQQINFTGNLDCVGETTMFFILEEAKETVLDF